MIRSVRTALVVTAVSLALGALVPSVASARIVRFQTPSRNIGCGYVPRSSLGPAVLRCDIRSGLNPEPRRRCELDWVGVIVGSKGKGRANCAGDTIYQRNARVLRYGTSWRGGGFTCTSRRVGLTCRNARRHGFFLALADWRVF
jgi:Family of unknown function (DUF6636)